MENQTEVVDPEEPGAKENYIMGKRVGAGLVSKLEGDAKKWLEDNKAQKKPIPNYWRKHADMDDAIEQGNIDVMEISLYDLLKEQFSGEVDARTAEVELKKYKWEPFKNLLTSKPT